MANNANHLNLEQFEKSEAILTPMSRKDDQDEGRKMSFVSDLRAHKNENDIWNNF